MPRIAVLGIGNVLMGDDAVGPHLVKLLEAWWRFPPEVEVVEAGTPGLDLALRLSGLDALVVADAVRDRGAPGEIRLYDRAGILARPPVQAMSPHEPGLREALFTLEFAGGAPGEVRLVGVIPDRVSSGVGLSPAVRQALPRGLEALLAELRRLGAAFEERVPPLEPELWWERPAPGRAGRPA